mgnify:CR=1 FL=1
MEHAHCPMEHMKTRQLLLKMVKSAQSAMAKISSILVADAAGVAQPNEV